MTYKDVLPGQHFRLFLVTETGSQTWFCLKRPTGDAVDLATGESIHVHPTKTVELATLRQSGRVGLLNDRPCIVSESRGGQRLCEYFVITGSAIVPQQAIRWVADGAKPPAVSREVNIIIAGIVLILRKCLKALQSQADTLETLLEVDIIQAEYIMSTSASENPETVAG